MNGTAPEQERDNRSDNRLTLATEKPNEPKLEAGWRRGYAADCKSQPLPREINALTDFRCSDNSGTDWERDNRARVAAAERLCRAIADCEPEDALFIMDRVCERMRQGAPSAVFMSALSDAVDWARFASRDELKAWAWVTFHALPLRDRQAFLGKVGGAQ